MRSSNSYPAHSMVVGLLTFALVAGPVAGLFAASARAEEGQAVQDASPWDGPLPSMLPESEVDRFVALWTPRMMDQAWFDGFLASEDVPADVAAEGFHADGLDASTRMHLVGALFDHLADSEEAFRAGFDGVGEAEATARLHQMKTMAYLFLFGRQELASALATDDPKPAAPDGPSEADLVFERQFEPLLTVTPLQVPSVEAMPAELATPEAVEVQVAEAPPALPFEPTPLFPSPVIAEGDPQPQAPPPDPASFARALMYSACGQLGSGAVVCSPVAVPFGVPVPLNLDGVATTGIGGMDVVVQVIPVPLSVPPVPPPIGPPDVPGLVSELQNIAHDAQTPGIGATLRISVLPDATAPTTARALPAKAWAVYGIANPGQPVTKVVTVGVDGTGSRLPQTSSLRFEIEDLPQLLAGRLLGEAELTFDQPGSSVAVSFGVSDVNGAGQAVNPTTVSLGLAPVPKLEVDLDARLDGSRFIGQVQSSASTVATITYSAVTSSTNTLAQVKLQNLPTSVTVDIQKTSGGLILGYVANSAIGRIDAVFQRTATGQVSQFANAVLLGLPATITLNLDFNAQSVVWTASAPVTSITATGRFIGDGRTWDATMTISGVPASWNLIYAGGHPLFRGVSGPLGLVQAAITNHGTYTTYAGNHLSVVYTSSNENLDASFRMTSINLAEYQQTTRGFRADMRMGGGLPFFVHGDVTVGTSRALADVSISPLPTSIQVTQTDDLFTYTANANFDLSAYAEVGHPGGAAASPDPPSVRGVSVRDGSGCATGLGCGTGVKARLFLQGFPTSFSSDASNRVVSVTNFKPPRDTLICTFVCFFIDRDSLTLDAELDNIVTTSVDVRAVQDGIPDPMSFTMGPITTDTVGTSKRTSVTYTASGAMGPFSADVKLGSSIVARLEVSNIPSSVSATITMGNPTSSVSVSTAQSINRIFAGAKLTATDSTYAGSIELLQIPTSVTLSFGRVETTVGSESFDGPGMSYSANADTLDINAAVEATLFGGDLKARARLDVDNLGRSTTLALSGSTLVATSSPSTANLEIHVWAEYRWFKSFSGCWPSSCPGNRIFWGDHAGVVPLTINDLKFKLTSFSSFTLRLGVASSIQGSYGVFDFGWSSITVKLDIELRFGGCVDFFVVSGCKTLFSYTNHNTYAVNILFHLATHHTGNWFNVCLFGAGGELKMDIRPHPHDFSWNGFAVSPPGSAEGSAWIVTPDPFDFVPDRLVQVAAAKLSPLGGDIDVDFEVFC